MRGSVVARRVESLVIKAHVTPPIAVRHGQLLRCCSPGWKLRTLGSDDFDVLFRLRPPADPTVFDASSSPNMSPGRLVDLRLQAFCRFRLTRRLSTTRKLIEPWASQQLSVFFQAQDAYTHPMAP
jgi:hypothetical protein